jgi:hypothetical protein
MVKKGIIKPKVASNPVFNIKMKGKGGKGIKCWAWRPLRLGGNNARRERAGSISGAVFPWCVSNETNTWNRRRDGPQNQPRLRIPWKSRCF